MKLNGQSRSFARQVQVDLLALDDADLFHTVHQWVEARNPSGLPSDVPEETRSALGYTHELAETASLLRSFPDAPGAESERSVQWCAPSPCYLRTLLTAMDVNVFAQLVIPLAFRLLHPIYPEWYEGMTFNAHLANHLRRMIYPAANRGQTRNT